MKANKKKVECRTKLLSLINTTVSANLHKEHAPECTNACSNNEVTWAKHMTKHYVIYHVYEKQL